MRRVALGDATRRLPHCHALTKHCQSVDRALSKLDKALSDVLNDNDNENENKLPTRLAGTTHTLPIFAIPFLLSRYFPADFIRRKTLTSQPTTAQSRSKPQIGIVAIPQELGGNYSA